MKNAAQSTPRVGASRRSVAESSANCIKLIMDYEGDPRSNPFVAVIGEKVGFCPHRPRPLHLRRYEPTLVAGQSVTCFNLCRTCGREGSSTDPTRLRLRVRAWTQSDLDRVAAVGKTT